jgi:glycosyltransferase involved in cell wall biosynthesis
MIKNVLYVFGGEVASGAEIVTERLIEKNGLSSHLFIAPGDFSAALIRDNKPYRINIIDKLKRLNRNNSSPLVFYFKALSKYIAVSVLVYRYIKKHNIDAVHCNTIGQASYLLPLVVCSPILCPQIKWIWTDHDLKYYFPLDNLLSVLCSRLYDITFAVSMAVKKKYKAGKKVVVLYNGLDSNKFNADLPSRKIFRTELNLPDEAIVIGNAGVMSSRKGQLNLINAFSALKKPNNTYLVLAGRFGSDEVIYSEKVKKVINQPGVIYMGHINDMVTFYNGCDIIVSNSDLKGSEPLGTTIYEAMACSKVVLGSDTGGTKEIIDDKVDGYLFEADNINSLVTTLINVIDNLLNQAAIKQAARQKVISKFNIDVMTTKYKEHLNN